MTKFAITIPNLNQSRFLSTVLESLRHQGRQFDLSIMDGGSTDDFGNVIEGYKDIIQYWRSGKDGGQSAAIIEGWRQVQGDILCWINADDYYFPESFDIVGKIFDQKQDVDVVYGDAVHVTAEGQFIGYFPAIRRYDRLRIGYDCFICQPACFVRRRAYDKIRGVRTKLKYTMDWDLWCQLSRSGAKFEYVNKPLAAVRYYEGTKTLTHSWRRYKEIFRIERKYGNRKFPISVFGANYYGWTLNKDRDSLANVYMLIYEGLRKLKNRFISAENSARQENDLLYGFERWDLTVHKACTIHLPWYPTHDWKRLVIKAQENSADLIIKVNDTPVHGIEDRKGEIHINLKVNWRPRLKIDLKSMKNDIWILDKIACR